MYVCKCNQSQGVGYCGGKGGGHVAKWGKYFAGNYHVQFGILLIFIHNLRAKMSCRPKLTELLVRL